MNPKKSSKKSIIIIVIIIILAVIGYFYYVGRTPAASDTLAVQPNSEAVLAASQVLSLLNQIKSLTIDSSIFRSPAYRTLRDYSVSIPETNVGRPNPFAPISGVQGTSTLGSSR